VIGGWLIKVLVGIAVLGFAVIELGSPLVARAQADDAAHEVANEASFRLRDNNTQATLDAACAEEAADQSVEIVQCTINEKNEILVEVRKEARSFLLDRFEQTKDWYDVTASATAERR
jgi:hypothetical protein